MGMSSFRISGELPARLRLLHNQSHPCAAEGLVHAFHKRVDERKLFAMQE